MNRYSVNPNVAAEARAKALEPADMSANLLTWCAVYGALQLALRHPQFPRMTCELVEAFVDRLGPMLVDKGFLTAATLQEATDLESRASAHRRQS